MRLIGKLLYVIGFLLMSVFGLIGGAFSAIYLIGFIGTAGREAGAELAWVGGVTLAGCAVGFVLARIGSALNPVDASFEA